MEQNKREEKRDADQENFRHHHGSDHDHDAAYVCTLLLAQADHVCYDTDGCAICTELSECRQFLRGLSSGTAQDGEERRPVFRREEDARPLPRTRSIRCGTLVSLKIKLTA